MGKASTPTTGGEFMGIGSIFGNTPCPGRKDQASGKLQQFAAGGRNRRTEAVVGIIRIATSGRKGHLPRFSGRRFGHHRARSEEHTSELKSLMRISYAVF